VLSFRQSVNTAVPMFQQLRMPIAVALVVFVLVSPGIAGGEKAVAQKERQAENRLLRTRWTYFGSLEGCVFEFLSGNRVWVTSYPQLGTWRVEGKRLTIEVQNPFCEGVNVYTGELDELSRDIRLQVIRSPYPGNIGREVILKRLPLPGFT
jgi:hypothetical protein